MSTYFTFWGPEDERRLEGRIRILTGKGEPAEAIIRYTEWQTLGRTITSAATHHAAFVAVRDMKEPDEELMRTISERAEACKNWKESELNFARDWAVHAAETAHTFVDAQEKLQEALQAIKQVIRKRSDDEDQDRSQLPVDKLALYKILILQGGPTNTQYASDHLEEMKGYNQLSDQARLDVEWWYFVAILILGNNAKARDLARGSLNSREGGDPKPVRRRAWRIASIPWIGPRLARVVIGYKLGL